MALSCLQREDPSLRVRVDEETMQIVLEGLTLVVLQLFVLYRRIPVEPTSVAEARPSCGCDHVPSGRGLLSLSAIRAHGARLTLIITCLQPPCTKPDEKTSLRKRHKHCKFSG